MADDGVTLRGINWREAFPFTHLFRAFRVSVHPSKIVLALLLLGCLWCAGLVLDAVWPENHRVTIEQAAELWGSSGTLATYHPEMLHSMDHWPDERAGIFRTFFDYEIAQANNILMFRGAPFESVWNFVATGPLWLWAAHWVFALIFTAWFLLVWSVLGGAISRIAAVHVARDEKISVRHALAFSVSKILSFIFAPVIPVLIILGIGLVIALASLALLHLSHPGVIIAGVLFFLALLGGFVITLVVLGTIGGFNLMYPTVAVEGSDSFDAISRSFSYVFARPWRMLWYTMVAAVYGAICYLFVRFFVWVMLAATWFFMFWLLPRNGQPATYWPTIWPRPADPLAVLRYTPDYQHLAWPEGVAAALIAWWVYLVIGLIGAFAISFYFSSNTIIYYLMRREVDATEMDDVYIEEADDELDEGVSSGGTGATPAPAGATAVVTETATVRVYQTPDANANTSESAAGGVNESAPPQAGEAPRP